MKKKFLTGMLLGTLALSATPFVVGCSDDDDISRLEEQIATNQNTSTVDKNELLTLINETKAALEEQLELATSGKADNQAVLELQEKVTALTEQLNVAAEGATQQITSLIADINDLVAQVNNVEGDLSSQKEELESEIAALEQSLAEANAANSENAQKLAEELTNLQNELQNVNTLIEKNGESIADLTLKIENLEGLTAKVEALESSSESYASDITEINNTLQSVVTGNATIEQELRGQIEAL